MKEETLRLKEQQDISSEIVEKMKKDIQDNQFRDKEAQFLIDRQEQYSRKNSVRVFDVKEESGENIEELLITLLKEEINLDIAPLEIKIIHHVGRTVPNKSRPVIIKFLSHKTKEMVMRRKKEAKTIKIREDLASGIKTLFDDLNKNLCYLNLDSV